MSCNNKERDIFYTTERKRERQELDKGSDHETTESARADVIYTSKRMLGKGFFLSFSTSSSTGLKKKEGTGLRE